MKTDRARLVLYYSAIPDDRIMVYDVRFRDGAATLTEAARRIQLFESKATPADFPACGPDWMPEHCFLKE